MNDVKDHKAVVITGASSGIGYSCALFLAQKGFQVFAGVRKQSDAERLQQAIPSVTPLILDVTNAEQIAHSVEVVKNAVRTKGIVGLVNNAGITATAPVEFLSLEELRTVLEVNVIGVVATTKAFMPLLRQAPYGRIINISSLGGTISSPYLSAYHASKFALEAISDAMRMELKAWKNLDVVVIKPASIKTPIWQKAVRDFSALLEQMPDEIRPQYAKELEIVTQHRQKADANGADPEVVAQAVHKALIAPKPRTRYLLAFNPVIFALLRYLPDRWRDSIIRRNLDL